MMVIFVSQCEKKAINRTQRVLDAFANRMGNGVWQTIITEDGLLAVKRLLKKTVTKNSAIACHWVRSRIRCDLLWIVGNRRQFNHLGIVPVNRTQKELIMDVMTMKAKKDEYYANTHLQILTEHLFAVGYVAEQLFCKAVNNDEHKKLSQVAFLAGCLHDLGKIDPLFQAWVKKGKRKDAEEDGQHIDSQFSFEEHPRHNEISWFLFNLFKSTTDLNTSQQERLEHLIYWHHAKPYRTKGDFSDMGKVYDYLCKNLKGPIEVNTLIKTAAHLLHNTQRLAQTYLDKATVLQTFTEQPLVSDELIYSLKKYPIPEFKIYSPVHVVNIQQDITINAYNNLLRACVISADRLVSKLTAGDLNDYIQQKRLIEIVEKTQDNDSLLLSQLAEVTTEFPDSERTQLQNQKANELAQQRDVAVLAGPAGCGKTRIALEWARLQQAKKIIWVCPRVQICQGIFKELTENYLPNTTIEIFTGEFKYTNQWEKPTKEADYFSADIVVTTIDQIVNSITTHTQVDALLPFMTAHVVFDEYHEYIQMDIFNLLFAELVAVKNMKANWQKNILLVSATPHYLYLKEILNIEAEDVVEMPSFNQSYYQIKFVDYNENDLENHPFFQPYSDNTFLISNTATTAQLGFIKHQQHENSVLLHSKFKRSDKKDWFDKVYEAFCEQGTQQYQVLRSGPIVQASLNITCDHMVTEITHAENTLQRLGRLDRFGKNSQTNTLVIAVTESIKRGKCIGGGALFLNKLHSLQATKAWYEFLQEQVEGKTFQLTALYTLYKSFYQQDCYQRYLCQDMEKALNSSITLLIAKVTEPIAIKAKSTTKQASISKRSLRGDSRFVQLALLNLENYQAPQFINQYAYQAPLNDTKPFDNLTESLSTVRDRGLINYMAQKHGNIDVTHPIKGIPDKKQTTRHLIIENYSRNPEYPIYLSYIEDDLDKVGGSSVRDSQAIYYAICDKQPIGALPYDKVETLTTAKQP